MLELKIFLKMKDFFAENFGNFWKKLFCERFRELLFSGKFFWGGGLEWKGAQILEYTHQPETGWHGPA
jgi:hypothetical protein